MPVTRDQFDADQATETGLLTTLLAAVAALLQNQAVLDLSAEDATVQAQITAIQNAQAALPPPPGPAKPSA